MVRSGIHLVAQLIVQGVRPALHEFLHLLEELRIFRTVDLPLARSRASFDVVVETHVTAPEDLVAAGAEGKMVRMSGRWSATTGRWCTARNSGRRRG